MAKKKQNLQTEVEEILNQLILKLKDVKELEVESNEDGQYSIGGEEEIYDEETDEYIENPNMATEEEKFLFSVREVCKELVKGRGDRVLTKYYTSTCW